MIGTITGPHSATNNCHYYRVQNFQQVQAVICFLWRWLGPIKRQQALGALSKFNAPRQYPPRKRGGNRHFRGGLA